MLLVALRSIHLYKYLQEWNRQWPHSPDCRVTLGLIRIERMNTSDAVALYRHHWECENTVTIMSFQFTRLWHQSNVLSQALEDSVRDPEIKLP